MINLEQLMNMQGRRVLITGSTGGIGTVMAETLAELGANLILVDCLDSNLENQKEILASKYNIALTTICCNLEVEDERHELIEAVKSDNQGLNCLINNAAFVGSSNLKGWVAPFEEQSLETWRRAFEVNLTTAFHLSQAFSSDLKEAKGANIVNIASIYGEYAPDWELYNDTKMGNPAAYSASKGGLIQLTRWLATTLGPDVRVNAISPGGVYRNQPKIFVDRYINKTPLKRMAVEDDFRGSVAYLTSDLSKYVTGQTLRVDGGWGVW